MHPGQQVRQGDVGRRGLEILGQARRAKNIDLEGQVGSMLLHGPHRNQGDYFFSVELFHFRPVKFSEFHVGPLPRNRFEIVSKSGIAIASQAKAIELRITRPFMPDGEYFSAVKVCLDRKSGSS